jgi:HEXXH motif-containing protein
MRSVSSADHQNFDLHKLSWRDFDQVAVGAISGEVVQRLRDVERSRRLLLMRALVDKVVKMPDLTGPFSVPEDAWDLLARAEMKSPAAFDLIIAHPYTGSWAGYTTRLVVSQVAGVLPLWMHIGQLHALAASAAIRAGLDFEISVPAWDGRVILPSLGMARLRPTAAHAVAQVRGEDGRFEIRLGSDHVIVPSSLDRDAPDWWSVRRFTARVAGYELSLWLDDIDPYRGLYEPVPPERLDRTEVETWHRLLADAWRLIVRHVPELAGALAEGLDALVPKPNIPFRNPSASTGEAFGSAQIALPDDAASLAVTLIHEFQHIVLGGVLHLTELYIDDPRERFYAPWRLDPRPLSRTLQGVYAFFGVTMFWRAVSRAPGESLARRAAFEFAHWRGQTWRALAQLRDDQSMMAAGRRFLGGIADRLRPWLREPVPDDLAALADALAADHYAGWRIRHLRPDPKAVAELAAAWVAGRKRAPIIHPRIGHPPTPVPDGSWSLERANLIRLAVAETDRATIGRLWSTVPDATTADRAYARNQFTEAIRAYEQELAMDPDRPASWVGLGLSIAATGTDPAAHALLHHPELVRAVYRVLRSTNGNTPKPIALATWIGQVAP